MGQSIRTFVFIISVWGIASTVYAGQAYNPFTGRLDLCSTVQEVDGSPSNASCGVVKVNNGGITDNGDGTYTLNLSVGSGTTNQIAYWSSSTALTGDTGLTYNASTDALTLGSATNADLVLTFDSTATTDMAFKWDNTNTRGDLNKALAVGGSGQSTFQEGVIVNNAASTNATSDFQVKGATIANTFYVDVSADKVGIGSAAPEQLLEVQGAEATDACLDLDADDGDDNADTWVVCSLAATNNLDFTNHTTSVASLTSSGGLTTATLDTGQGANDLFDMDQNVLTTSAVTFATVDTGQGANELYAMNQAVQTSNSPTFAAVLLTPVTVAGLGTATAGLLKAISDGTSSTDCTVGGGSTYNLCMGNGAAWIDM